MKSLQVYSSCFNIFQFIYRLQYLFIVKFFYFHSSTKYSFHILSKSSSIKTVDNPHTSYLHPHFTSSQPLIIVQYIRVYLYFHYEEYPAFIPGSSFLFLLFHVIILFIFHCDLHFYFRCLPTSLTSVASSSSELPIVFCGTFLYISYRHSFSFDLSFSTIISLLIQAQHRPQNVFRFHLFSTLCIQNIT